MTRNNSISNAFLALFAIMAALTAVTASANDEAICGQDDAKKIPAGTKVRFKSYLGFDQKRKVSYLSNLKGTTCFVTSKEKVDAIEQGQEAVVKKVRTQSLGSPLNHDYTHELIIDLDDPVLAGIYCKWHGVDLINPTYTIDLAKDMLAPHVEIHADTSACDGPKQIYTGTGGSADDSFGNLAQ